MKNEKCLHIWNIRKILIRKKLSYKMFNNKKCNNPRIDRQFHWFTSTKHLWCLILYFFFQIQIKAIQYEKMGIKIPGDFQAKIRKKTKYISKSKLKSMNVECPKCHKVAFKLYADGQAVCYSCGLTLNNINEIDSEDEDNIYWYNFTYYKLKLVTKLNLQMTLYHTMVCFEWNLHTQIWALLLWES